MNRKHSAVRSTLGWLLLAACVVLAVCGALCGHMPAQGTAWAASGRKAAVEAIPVQTGAICVNNAGVEELQQLPGVGESIARAIWAERMQNGPFFYPEDLLHVKGIGSKKLEEMRPLLDLTEDMP